MECTIALTVTHETHPSQENRSPNDDHKLTDIGVIVQAASQYSTAPYTKNTHITKSMHK